MDLLENLDRKFVDITRAAKFEISREAIPKRAFFKLCCSAA